MILAVTGLSAQTVGDYVKTNRDDIVNGTPIKEPYKVEGETADEIRKSEKKNSPHPDGHIGNTKWNFVDNEMLGAGIVAEKKCHDGKHTVIVHYEPSTVGLLIIVQLPEWTKIKDSPARLWWPRHILELEVHEDGHVQIAKTGHEFAHKNHLVLRGMATADTLKAARQQAVEELRRQKDELLNTYLQRTKSYQAAYDKATRHGKAAAFQNDQKVAAELVEKMKTEFSETLKTSAAAAAKTRKRFAGLREGNCELEHSKEDLNPDTAEEEMRESKEQPREDESTPLEGQRESKFKRGR